jgi:hypothetical protein
MVPHILKLGTDRGEWSTSLTKMAVFWVVAPCRAIALMMEAARTSETLVNFCQITRCYNPEDSHLHTHRRENLKSYNFTNVHFKFTE